MKRLRRVRYQTATKPLPDHMSEIMAGVGLGIALFLLAQNQGWLPQLPARDPIQGEQPPELPHP